MPVNRFDKEAMMIECPVCLDNVLDKEEEHEDENVAAQCDHCKTVFCTRCLLISLLKYRKCPCCRDPK